MRAEDPRPVRLVDYRPSDFLIDTVRLDVVLDPHATRVTARLALRPNPAGRAGAALVLDGDELTLVSAAIDGAPIASGDADVGPSSLVIATPPRGAFELTLVTEIDPEANKALDGLAALGRGALGMVAATGRLTLFGLEGVSHWVRPPFHGRAFLRAFVEFAYFSLPVVALTAVFTGMVLALQSATGLARFSAESAVANLVVLSITRELGPVLAGLMVAGRVGAAMAAELGTMRVTDQIDALTTLSTDPMKYLVAPRILAAMLAMPFLVLVADILGVMGGYIIGTFKLGFVSAAFLDSVWDVLQVMDVVSGLVKAAVFGFVIGWMGCWCGYRSQGGAQGVGLATTSAVVAASILILAMDYMVTEAFFAQ